MKKKKKKKTYGDKGLNLYTGPWTLFDDVDTSEEK